MMKTERITEIKERSQQLLDDGIVLFRQDIESNLELVTEVERQSAEIARLREHIESALFYVENTGNFRDVYDELKEALG